MTGISHEHSEIVVEAAQWLAEQHPAPHPAVPLLRSRFDLSAVQACEAIAMAQRFRTYRKVHA